MSELLTSPEDAKFLRIAIMKIVDMLEDQGFNRAQVGSAMVGIGAGIVGGQLGISRCIDVLDGAKNAALASNPH